MRSHCLATCAASALARRRAPGPVLAPGPLTCALAGALAGIGVTWRAWRAAVARRQRWLLTMLIALATAALGCADMGAAAIATTLLAIVVAAALALLPGPARRG